MEGHVLLSRKELARKREFVLVKQGYLTLKKAARRLGLSYRQTRRAYRRYREEGAAGLAHGSRGRPSNRRKPEKFKRKVLARYRARYEKLEPGPTYAAEKLAEDGLEVDHETLRRWLLAEGLRTKRGRRKGHRERRERRKHFGELVQLDGSHHRWFGPEREQCCAMQMVDDAKSERLVWMSQEETSEAAMRVLWMWIERYGVPRALYTDRKNVYVTEREPTPEEQLEDQKPKTAFGKACEKLGIEIIPAQSPQAKGRVERLHGILQDRLVKELALRGIARISSANRFLQGGFTDDLNRRFGVEPADPEDYHLPVPKGLNLENVFCFEEHRVVQNDWTLRYKNSHYQILKTSRPLPRPKDQVLVRRHLDGRIVVLHRGRALDIRKIPAAELRKRMRKDKPRPAPPRASTAKPARTPTNSPWRQNCTLMFADTRDDP